MECKWTDVFCDNTHVKNCPDTHRISMQYWGENAEVSLVCRLSGHPFTAREKFWGSHEDCRAKANEWLSRIAA